MKGLLVMSVVFAAVLRIPSSVDALVDAPAANLEKNQKKDSPAEIRALVADLGHVNYRIRETASRELIGIGEAALGPLQEAESTSDPEIQSRARSLISKICLTRGISLMKGLQFRAVIDKEWRFHQPAKEGEIKIKLEVRNVSSAVQRLYLYQTVRGILRDAKGNVLPSWQGVQARASNAQVISPALPPGGSHTLFFEGELMSSKEGLMFRCEDLFSSSWGFRRITKGTYSLALVYHNETQTANDAIPVWVGSVETIAQTIHVR